MSNTKTEAQRLAALLDHGNDTSQIEREVINELRRLDAHNKAMHKIIDQLRAQLAKAVAEEREAFEAWAKKQSAKMHKDIDGDYLNLGTQCAWLAWQARAAIAQPAEGGEVVDWEHIARILDAALQELIVFVDERWGDNECRPLENAKHALGLIKED